MIIALTGASGSIGKVVLNKIMQNGDVFLKILLRNSKKNIKFVKKLKKQYKNKIEIIYGDITNIEDCVNLIGGTSYTIHLAAMIPPQADHHENAAIKINETGTQNIIQAILRNNNQSKLIYMSTVAVYGNRNGKHYWGRVGDPLLPGPFDIYGSTKLRSERHILDSELNNFVILRETAVLYDNLLMNNIKDGLIFQTCLNTHIEWTTAVDTAELINNIIMEDGAREDKQFWNKIYNVGGGEQSRQTGYEAFNDGFKIIGSDIETFFEPNWTLPERNFHCFWFSDSDRLNEILHFRKQSSSDFWEFYKNKHKLYSLGKIINPEIIKTFVLEPLLNSSTAPMCWINNNDLPRLQAYYGGREKASQIETNWQNVDLICKKDGYNKTKHTKNATFLSHGYNENKKDEDIDIQDLKDAAKFRGGECLAKTMEKGDLYSKVKWRCHDGHEFFASPYTILKAGHWCDKCALPLDEWNLDKLAKHSPFHAQVWYDFHEKDENFIYKLKNGVASMEKFE